MRKRLLACLIGVVLTLPLGGCWNYRGLDQMNLVVGIAIDFDRETNLYNITYEVADLSAAEKKSAINGKLVEAQGKTLFDAARNAKLREADKLFFGSAYIVVLSEEVARRNGISGVIDWFLRDAECRETMCVALSQQETARAVLEAPEDASGIMSVILCDIIMEDAQVTATSIHTELYEVYNALKSPRQSLMVAAVHKIKDKEREIDELNGIAVFKKDKLAGFLTREESKYAMFAENQLKGGLLTFSLAGGSTDDITLEIFKNQTEKSFSYEGGKLTFTIKTHTDVAIAENTGELGLMDEGLVAKIEDKAARMIEKGVGDVVAKAQKEYNADIFGFGEMIYKHRLPLWRQLEPQWDEVFPTVKVEVTSEVHVVNSAFLE